MSVVNLKQDIVEKVKIDNYTFKQLFEKFKEVKMLTPDEMKLDKKYHIRPENKPFGHQYCHCLTTAYHNSEALYDKVYKELRTSDFIQHLQSSGKSKDSQRQMINLYKAMDKFALEEDIIDKGYAQFIPASNKRKEIKKAKDKKVEKERIFTYEQIEYLWNFKNRKQGMQTEKQQERETFIRNLWLMLNYCGCRVDELLSTYTANVFLDEDYFIAGLKTEAGINREIPIHPLVKHLFEKYYNPDNEFLFTQPNGNRIDYDYYLYHFEHNFKDLHPELAGHTAHDARHTLRNELRMLGVKDIIINSIIGHSNENVGDDIYSHVSIKEKLEAIKMVTYKEQKKLYILSTNLEKTGTETH